MMDLARILIAPLVWLALFSAVYGLQGIICGFGVTGDVLGMPVARILLAGAFASAIAVQVALLWLLLRARFSSTSGFVNFVARTSGWVGVVAAVWTMLPVVFTTSCI